MIPESILLLLSTVPDCNIVTRDYGDSVLVVQTVCAPICSSCARVYDKNGKLQRVIEPPFEDAIFPYATLEGDTLVWEDRTSEVLDEEEKKRIMQKKDTED